VSFVHVCQYVTDWYTDPSLPARILVEAETRACDWDRSRSTTNNARNWDLPVSLHFLLVGECKARFAFASSFWCAIKM